MKKFQLEVWNTFDKFCLMSAITKLKTSFADQNWVAISRYTKQLHENISSFIQYDHRSDEWFSAKQCSAQYEVLIKGSGARKKKKVDRNFDYSDVHDALLLSINQEFCEELTQSLGDIREDYLETKQLLDDLDDHKIDDDRLEELIAEMITEKPETEKEKQSDIKTKLKCMLDEKNAMESESNAKFSSPTLQPNEPSTSSEHKAANITTSPLLTSLLQSPSPLVRPSPSTSSPTISLLLHSSPSVSLTDPTLSKLLESPASLPGTSTISSVESPSFLFQGTILNPQQSSSESKKKQSDSNEDITVQRVVNEPVEYQRTEVFDDMSDIEQGVVESEVIIENESSPIKRLTPRRLDLENIGDEEPEEEILETVEEIIERVEEAIIETVGENNLNELVLNEEIDTVSISDEEMEHISIEDSSFEVIVVGSSQEETVPTSNDSSEDIVVIDESLSKIDKNKNIENNHVEKRAEIFPVDDQIRIDTISKSVNHPTVNISDEGLSVNILKENGKSCDEEEKSEVNDGIDEELSNGIVIQQEKSDENSVISVPDNCLEKESVGDLETDTGSTSKDDLLAANSNSNIVKPTENLVSTSEDNHSFVECVNEAVIDKNVSASNECQETLNSDSVLNVQPENSIISIDNEHRQPIEKKITEEIELQVSVKESEVDYNTEAFKMLDTEKPSNKLDFDSSDSQKPPELNKDNLTNISIKGLEGKYENEKLELHNEDVLNSDKNIEEASKDVKTDVFNDSQQAASIPTSPNEKHSTTAETMAKQIHFNKKNPAKSKYEEPITATISCKDRVIPTDSDLGGSEKLELSSKEIENPAPVLKPNKAGELVVEKKISIEQHKKDIINSRQVEDNVISGISHSEDEKEGFNTINISLKTDKKNNVESDNIKLKSLLIGDVKKPNLETKIITMEISEESQEVKEIPKTQGNLEVLETCKVQETREAQGTIEAQETREAQESQEVQETEEVQETQKTLETHETEEKREAQETQESHDGFYERTSGQIYIESDESKSDSTEETEENSILTTEDSKDGLDDSLKFSSLETLSMPSVDSPPEYSDPKFAGLNTKEKEFRSLIGKGFEELKNKAAELVFIPDTGFEDKAGSSKHAKTKNKPRTKKDKSFKTKKMMEKASWDKSNESKSLKEKPSKDRTSSKDRPSTEKLANVSRKSKYMSSLDSKPDSPSLSTTSSDEDRDYKSWKKSILLVYNRLASHKYASVFSKPITENEAPSYHQLILRPMDLSTIKRNIENGVIRTTVEFQRDMLLMVQNAIIYNKFDTPVYDMAKAMGEDMLAQMEVMVQALGDGVPLIGDTSEEKQITRARTSKTTVETPQSKKRKTQDPDEIRPKRNKVSTP